RLASSAGAANRLSGRVVQVSFLGDASEHLIAVDGAQLKMIRTPPVFDAPPEVSVEFDAADALALPD
ncbi:MAG TPA: TOBE domain-containing protein, partial [Tepidisphaeraceae bacterium]|nr:TOBE domain-containing protein [Tepidisphaeraceae bacterium]